MYKDAAFSIGIHSRRGRLVAGSEQYPLLSLLSTDAALSVCTQSVLLLPNIRIATDEDASRPISPEKSITTLQQADNSTKHLPILGDPPIPCTISQDG